ncbi:discoidin domain-containing protein [Burkholderia aenigmatica]|uniref:discoidin domain-containing protein n=1 Tax=Burkholderia aenigmatica TaxID=2015348 RepID=UPI00264CA120|nr:discoidin domain-containing protein [Burkholderia aenigmatica]MDN7880594.1 discoidin domain-containing protein [Burkholderia aenigmatica]
MKKILLLVMSVLCSQVAKSQVFSETFNNFPGIQQTYVMSNVLSCPSIPGPDPKNLNWITPPPPLDKWGMFIGGSGVANYPFTWQGPGPTQSWAVVGNQMNVHAPDGGFAFITGQTFDSSKYLEAEADIRLYAQNDLSGGFAGLTLIGSEADYREISFRTVGNNTVQLKRNAPCDEAALTDAAGNNIVFSTAVPHRLRIEYRGPDGGGWRYFVDGTPVYLWQNGTLSSTEAGTYLNAQLRTAPRLGIYWVPPQGAYVEGSQANIQVYQLGQVQPVSAYASGTYGTSYPTNVLDGNPATFWNSGGFPQQWIELDLGQVVPIRKIRLLTLQSPSSGYTSHTIYAGTTPAPTTAVQTLSGTTSDSQWLEMDTTDAPVSARYVRVLTTQSNSWVAWRDIQVFQ